MIEIIPLILGERWIPLDGPLKVDLKLYITTPKKTKLAAPRADIDNYVKSIFDSMNSKCWVDDTQIIEVYAIKHWAHPKQRGHFTMQVTELE